MSTLKVQSLYLNPDGSAKIALDQNNKILLTSNSEVKVSANLVANNFQDYTGSDIRGKFDIRTINTSGTLALTDIGRIIETDGGSSSTNVYVQIPNDGAIAWPSGARIDIVQVNVGPTFIANSVGVSLYSKSNTSIATSNVLIFDRYSGATVYRRAANTWVVLGDIT